MFEWTCRACGKKNFHPIVNVCECRIQVIKMLVKEMKEILEEMDDNDKLVIRAINGPPWIKHFVIEKVEEKDEEK